MIKPLTAVAVLLSVLFVTPGPGEPWFFEDEPAVCLEDMECWDWRTMGNGKRGME